MDKIYSHFSVEVLIMTIQKITYILTNWLMYDKLLGSPRVYNYA